MKSLRKTLIPLLSSLTLLFSAQVFSNDCQLTFSQPAVSFGRFKQDDIAASKQTWNRMPAKEVTVNVYCPKPQLMALFLQSASGSQGGVLFGQEGRLVLIANNMIADGQPCDLAKTTDRLQFATTESPSQKLYLKNNDGLIARHNAEPIRAKQMSFNLKIIPVLNDTQLRHVSDNVGLESVLAWELLTIE